MLTDFPEDIQGVILHKLDNVSIIMLCHVNKNYHQIVSSWAIKNKVNRYLELHEIASCGYLEVLKWAYEHEKGYGPSCDDRICTNAAKNGHLEVLKWVRINDFPWDASVCSLAARNGNLEVLRWAKENGCKLNANTYISAVTWNHVEMIKWLEENNCRFIKVDKT
jgi:hypothetical protein